MSCECSKDLGGRFALGSGLGVNLVVAVLDVGPRVLGQLERQHGLAQQIFDDQYPETTNHTSGPGMSDLPLHECRQRRDLDRGHGDRVAEQQQRH